ncbi:MAG: topoisomerase C-terminal repeat-containing protein [bacterium]
MNENNLTKLECPACGKKIIETDSLFECEDHRYDKEKKEASGCNFVIWKQKLNKEISLKTFKRLLNDEIIDIKGFIKKDGKKFDAKMKLEYDEDEDKYDVKLIFDKKNSSEKLEEI